MQDKEVELFLEYESFLNYCFGRNSEDVRYWQQWLKEHPEHNHQVEAMRQLVILTAEENRKREVVNDYADLQSRIEGQQVSQTQISRLWPRIAAAASVLLFSSIGGYFMLHEKPTQQQQVAQNQQQDFKPGRNQATLTLANGQKIILYRGLTGKLAQQGNTLIQVTGANIVAYTAGEPETASEVTYNTLTTKNGEQSPYPLALADGSKVWLNAASSITFPTAFNGKSREVKVTGEAYFEISHKIRQPFKVFANGQVIEDLGTHFNINAYKDEEATKTTLLEGKVKVSRGISNVILKPGQQSVYTVNGAMSVKEVNIEGAVAWKNGIFHYEKANIKTIMRSFERWYDVSVEYEGDVSGRNFTGDIHRDIKASQALKILSILNIGYRIDGKKIIIISQK